MNNNLELITVNEKQDYHNCEMTFSFFYNNEKSDFKVDEEQNYKIHTTIKEVNALNEALNVYQKKGFKEMYLLYTAEVDGSQKYPAFVIDYIDAITLGRTLQSLANDEDSLTQLSEYCLEVAPTYADDFCINKQINSIIIEGKEKEVNGYEDLEDYISQVNR